MRGFSVFRARGKRARDISIRIVSSLTTVLAVTAGSCTDTKAGSMGDASLDRGLTDCHLPLAEHGPFGDCPATFADDGWKARVCDFISPTFMPNVSERTCDGYRVRSFGFGTHSWACYYESTALTLVAAEYTDDTNDLCNFTAYHEVLGDIPPGKCAASVMVDMPCGPLDAGGQ
jgi:hypothetical protein